MGFTPPVVGAHEDVAKSITEELRAKDVIINNLQKEIASVKKNFSANLMKMRDTLKKYTNDEIEKKLNAFKAEVFFLLFW